MENPDNFAATLTARLRPLEVARVGTAAAYFADATSPAFDQR